MKLFLSVIYKSPIKLECLLAKKLSIDKQSSLLRPFFNYSGNFLHHCAQEGRKKFFKDCHLTQNRLLSFSLNQALHDSL